MDVGGLAGGGVLAKGSEFLPADLADYAPATAGIFDSGFLR